MPSAPMLALALVVQGSGIVEKLLPRSRPLLHRPLVAGSPPRPALASAPDAYRSRRPGLVPRAPERATAGSSSSSRCSPTGSSTPGTTSRSSRAAARDTKAKLISPMAEPPDPRELGNAWYDAYHALSAYLQVDGFDVVHDHAGIVGPDLRRDAARAGRRSCTRCTDRGRRRPRLLYSLAASARAPRRDQRRAAGRQPRRRRTSAPCTTASTSTRTRTASEKDDVLVYIGRSNPDKGPKEAINDRPPRRPAAADDPEAQRAARARVLRARDRAAARERHRAATRTCRTRRRSRCSAGPAR